MRIAIRLDDIAPFMHWENLSRMIALLEERNAMPLLGVIPLCEDQKLMHLQGVSERPEEEFLRFVKDLETRGAVIAMHGVHHVYRTEDGGMFPLNDRAELAGLPLAEQEDMLEEARQQMEEWGFDTDIFMAPAHSYDENTLTALKRLDFRRITDGFGRSPYRYREMTFYPIAVLRERAAKSRAKGSVTLVYHVNTMSDADFEAAAALFDRAELIPYRTLLEEPTSRRPSALMRAEHYAARTKRFLAARKRKKK